MIVSLQKLLNIKPEEGRPVLLLTAYYFFITATAIAGRSVSNALFFSRVENADSIFPFMLITVTLTGVVTMQVYTRMAKRIRLILLLSTTGLFFAGVLGGFWLFIEQHWTPYALFVFLEVVNIVMFFQFYIFAGTIFDTRQAKRIFGILGVGGAIASILSGLALRPFTAAFGSEAVILLTIGFILMWVLMIRLARPYMRPEEKPPPAASQPKTGASGRLDGYLRTMAVVIASTILVATIVEYQFKVISTRDFADAAEMTAFFGSFFALVGFCQIIIRLFVVGNLLSRFGVLAGLILLPVGLAFSSVAVLLNPMLIPAVILKAVDQVLRYTLNETSMELLWVPISPQRKLAVKPIINGTIPTVLQGVAGLMIFFIVSSFEVRALSVVVLVIIAVWIPMTFRLRRGYIDELMKSIQQRELALEDLTIDTTDAAIVRVIDDSLNSADEVEQAFTLSIIEGLSLTPWAATLNRLFQTSESFFIRQKILDLAGDYPDIIPDDALLHIIETEHADLIDEAIRAAGQRGMNQIIPILEIYLDPDHHSTPEVRAAAAYAILTMNQGPVELAQDTLREMLESVDTNESALALQTLAQLPTAIASALVHESLLREMLHSRSTRARRVILEMVVNPGYWAKEKPADNDTILSVALNLQKAATRPTAEQVLRNYLAGHVIEVLTAILRDKGSPASLKLGVIQALRNYPEMQVATQIIDQMNASSLELYTASVQTLLHIARQQPLSPELLNQINGELLQVARVIYKNYQLLAQIGADEPLLADIVMSEIRAALPALLKLAVIDVPDMQIETMIEQLQAPDPANLANILEIFDNVLSKSEREIIIPLFEVHTVSELADLGRRYFGALAHDVDQSIVEFVLSSDEWHSLVALDYLLRHQPEAALTSLNWHRVPNSDANRQIVSRYVRDNGHTLLVEIPDIRFPPHHGEGTMFTTLEKTILLRGVGLFSAVPADEIFHIAQIADEETIAANEMLFNEGDAGNCLYIVVEGSIRVHKGDQALAVFEKGDTLGEMALFDNLPRSATATAVTDSVLLRISREQFFDVMATRMEIMQSMVRTLSLRVRAANEQVAELTARL
jgi:ATP:ADP antiporter, AAA family